MLGTFIASLLNGKEFLSHIDGVTGTTVCGWAFSPMSPHLRLTISAETRAGRFTNIIADAYRADVHKAAIGSDGYCGFSIAFDDFRWNGPCRIFEARTRTALHGSPVFRETPALRVMPKAVAGRYLFALWSRPPHLSGWLSSLDDTGDRRQIALEVDERLVARQRACLYRPDQATPGLDPFHGFALTLPSGWRSFRLLDAMSGVTLLARRRRRP